MEKMQNWKHCILLCSDCSLTPPQNQKWKLGCSECSSTLQWLQSNAPRIRSGSCGCSEYYAVQHCSDCSPTPLGIESEVEVGLQWVQFNQPCSDCSLNPPSLSEVDLQWVQSNCAATAVQPSPKSEVEVGLQWVQFNFAVTAVWPPLKNKQNTCSGMPSTGKSIMGNRLHSFHKLIWEKPQGNKFFLG